jgi:predicted nuclease of restriction endonuclease-like (RecB) superfamily
VNLTRQFKILLKIKTALTRQMQSTILQMQITQIVRVLSIITQPQILQVIKLKHKIIQIYSATKFTKIQHQQAILSREISGVTL